MSVSDEGEDEEEVFSASKKPAKKKAAKKTGAAASAAAAADGPKAKKPKVRTRRFLHAALSTGSVLRAPFCHAWRSRPLPVWTREQGCGNGSDLCAFFSASVGFQKARAY